MKEGILSAAALVANPPGCEGSSFQKDGRSIYSFTLRNQVTARQVSHLWSDTWVPTMKMDGNRKSRRRTPAPKDYATVTPPAIPFCCSPSEASSPFLRISLTQSYPISPFDLEFDTYDPWRIMTQSGFMN